MECTCTMEGDAITSLCMAHRVAMTANGLDGDESLRVEVERLKGEVDGRRARLLPGYSGPEECCSCHILSPCEYCLEQPAREAAEQDEREIISLSAEVERLKVDAKELVARIAEIDRESDEPRLGFATTKQLFEEISARIEMGESFDETVSREEGDVDGGEREVRRWQKRTDSKRGPSFSRQSCPATKHLSFA